MALFDCVFEGGGAKGTAFVGALEVLAAAGHSHRRLVGTSAGAITATLLGAGYTPAEMLAAVNETLPGTNTPVFTTFMDAPEAGDFSDADKQNSETMRLINMAHLPIPAFIKLKILDALLEVDLYRELFSFNECGGFYAGNAFLTWFRSKLQAKGLDPDLDWHDFAQRTGADVSVVTSDVTEKEMVVLNTRTAPTCPVAMSVRMSMSIPFVWREVEWNAAWGQYRNRDKTGHIFVDGGVLSNFPLALVADSSPEIQAIMGTTDPGGAANLGLLLDESIPVPGAEHSDTRRPRLRTADRVTALIDLMTGASDQEVMREHPDEICRIPVGGFGTTEFRMSEQRMDLLIDSGREAMTSYLKSLKPTNTGSAQRLSA